ncbi:MAG: hypothetical protein DRN14_06105 [Thermoplasmata archaeon]|nr:MAG: hypothetical protein DRN14_06105 [Thermoplasmata archaeon]
MMNKSINRDGYIALSTVLVILSVIVVVGISVSMTAVSELQTSFGSKQSVESLDIVEACVEDALLSINENDSVSDMITLPEGTCTVTTNSQSGNNWDITVSSTNNDYTRSIRVKAVRGVGVSIISWSES